MIKLKLVKGPIYLTEEQKSRIMAAFVKSVDEDENWNEAIWRSSQIGKPVDQRQTFEDWLADVVEKEKNKWII